VPLDLLTAATPADPVLDVALSHALLADVAAGRRPPTLRVFRPGRAVAFGRLDALRPGFARACGVAAARGRTPMVRNVGGHAAVLDSGCLVVEEIGFERDVTAGLQARFAGQSRRLRDALASLGADAGVGELPGEYCPGAHSIHVDGRLKVVGIAQRAIRHGALVSAVVVVAGGARLRADVEAVYAALGLEVAAGTAGSLDEALPGVTVEAVAARVLAAYAGGGALVARELDAELEAAASALAPTHRAPPDSVPAMS
jgi:lipoate-protein ligase A